MLDPQPDPDNAGRRKPTALLLQLQGPYGKRGAFFLARKGGAVEASVAIQVLPQFVESTEEVVHIVDEAITTSSRSSQMPTWVRSRPLSRASTTIA